MLRLLSVAVIITLLSWSEAAQAASADPTSQPWNFGRASCGQAFACNMLNTSTMTPQMLAATADSCIRQNFGHNVNGGAFEDRRLTSGNCLVTKPADNKDGGVHLSPKCCVVEDPANKNSCNLICDMLAIR